MTALEIILLSYCVFVAVVVVIQTIRLELVREELAERDAMLARQKHPTCVFPNCVATCERRAA